MPRISDAQLDKLIAQANDPDEFAKLPSDKVIVSRVAFQTLLDNLKLAREDASDSTAWMDVATELADDLLAVSPHTHFSQAVEGSALYKFNVLASSVEATL